MIARADIGGLAGAAAAALLVLAGCSLVLDSRPGPADAGSDLPLDGAEQAEVEAADLDVLEEDRRNEKNPDPEDVLHDKEDGEDEGGPLDPCLLVETCNLRDDDRDGNVDERPECEASIRFTDARPALGAALDVILVSSRDRNCVELFVTPPSGRMFKVADEMDIGWDEDNEYRVGVHTHYKWDFTVELPEEEDQGEYRFAFRHQPGCSSDCDCAADELIGAALRVGPGSDLDGPGCNGLDDDGDGRVDENCLDGIRFTDYNARPGDVIDAVGTWHIGLVCLALYVDPPIGSPFRQGRFMKGVTPITRHDDYSKWDWSVVLPVGGGGENYEFTMKHQYEDTEECTLPECNCDEAVAATAVLAVCDDSES
jgi:hypothetical protein